MKYAIGLLLTLACGVAGAEQLLVRTGYGHQCKGEIFKVNEPLEVLFVERKCELPLAHASDLRAYVFRAQGTVIKGCWGKLMNGNYLLIDQNGNQEVIPRNGYAEAVTTSGMNAKITYSPNQGTPYAIATGMCP